MLVFCNPEYLFGIPATGGCIGNAGQSSLLVEKKERISVVNIDDAHKIFGFENN